MASPLDAAQTVVVLGCPTGGATRGLELSRSSMPEHPAMGLAGIENFAIHSSDDSQAIQSLAPPVPGLNKETFCRRDEPDGLARIQERRLWRLSVKLVVV